MPYVSTKLQLYIWGDIYKATNLPLTFPLLQVTTCSFFSLGKLALICQLLLLEPALKIIFKTISTVLSNPNR